MSKQSNQKYRKEKEQEHLKKAGLESAVTGSYKNHHDPDKISTEYESPSSGTGR